MVDNNTRWPSSQCFRSAPTVSSSHVDCGSNEGQERSSLDTEPVVLEDMESWKLPEIEFLFHSLPLPPYWNLPLLGQKGEQNGLTAFPLLYSFFCVELGECLDVAKSL